MLFEVYKDNKRMFWTTDEFCVPDSSEINHLKAGGYKIKQSGDNAAKENAKPNATEQTAQEKTKTKTKAATAEKTKKRVDK